MIDSRQMNASLYLRLVLVMAVAVGTFLAGNSIVSADNDMVFTDECANGQEVSSIIDTGSGPTETWTLLDNQAIHGWADGFCPWSTCRWFYNSGHPASNRQIDELWSWAAIETQIWLYNCYD